MPIFFVLQSGWSTNFNSCKLIRLCIVMHLRVGSHMVKSTGSVEVHAYDVSKTDALDVVIIDCSSN